MSHAHLRSSVPEAYSCTYLPQLGEVHSPENEVTTGEAQNPSQQDNSPQNLMLVVFHVLSFSKCQYLRPNNSSIISRYLRPGHIPLLHTYHHVISLVAPNAKCSLSSCPLKLPQKSDKQQTQKGKPIGIFINPSISSAHNS